MKTKVVYIAEDGTEFLSQDVCKDYENKTNLIENIRKSIRNCKTETDMSKEITHFIMLDFHIAPRCG